MHICHHLGDNHVRLSKYRIAITSLDGKLNSLQFGFKKNGESVTIVELLRRKYGNYEVSTLKMSNEIHTF